MCVCVKLKALVDSEMKLYHVTQVLQPGINIKTMSPNYISRILKKHDIAFIEVYLGAWSRKKLSPKIISVKLLVIVYKVFKRYPSTYCLVQGCCFICSDFEHFTSTLELQPLSVYHVVLRLD